MNYYIGIASYHRAGRQKTLDFLEEIHFPRKRIIMSVQTFQDLTEYHKAGIAKRVGKLLFREASTAGGNRNTILDNLPMGERVLLLDDDVRGIERLDGKYVERLRSRKQLDDLVEYGFRKAEEYKTICFGLYAHSIWGGGGLKERATLTGCFMGTLVTEIRFDPETYNGEDVEYSCEVLRKYGKCLRFDDYRVLHSYDTLGGCWESRRNKALMLKDAQKLAQKYPDMLRVNPKDPYNVSQKRLN